MNVRSVGSLVVRASDSRPEGLGSMLDVTKYPPSALAEIVESCVTAHDPVKKPRSLDQLTFSIALARQLIDGYSSRKRKGHPVRKEEKSEILDDMRLDNVGNHMLKTVSNYRKDLIDELKIFGMSSRHHIDDFMRRRIIGKIEEGRKLTDVAREFDIAHSVVSRLWKSFKTTGMCSRRHGGGRVRRKQISRKTVARRLRGGGLYARRPVVCVPLTRQHRTACLQWCREHHNWTEQDWACVLFSDEKNIQEKDRYPTCSVMVWAGIMINGRTRLHVVANGTMTGQRYIDEVLLPHVRLFRGAPARSPNLNPVENVWDALGRQVAGRNSPPTNKNTLIRALTEEWDKLPQQLLDNVVQTRATIDLLKDTFGDRLISRFGPLNWPPRSCDLAPLDYFLWGYVKSLVYADKPQTLDHSEDNIRRVIADIRPQMLEKVIENWTSRLDYIRASRGSHMPEIIFKM
ncbi:transposable element Tcb2 transposase [Trichonephila clavipes]|nr:transposable element Tcb2 transposase [Trichonephila clavipes]